MQFIPLREKTPILKKHVYWSRKPFKNQTAIGIVNGIDGLTCLDIDLKDLQACERTLGQIRAAFPNYNFGLVRTHSGKYHIYFRYFGQTHKSIQFLVTQNGDHFGELRCNRHQVFPSGDPNYTWSNRYTLIQDLNDLPILNDQDIERLMQEMAICFATKKLKPAKVTRAGSIEREEEIVTNDSATLLEWDCSLKSYLPTSWDMNQPMMLTLLRAIYRRGLYAECDTYFQRWLGLNQFKRHSNDDYYWKKWEGIKKNFSPSKLRPFESFPDLVSRSMEEAVTKGLRSRQKQVTHAIECLIPRIKDEYGLFHLGSHSKFFDQNNVHPEEVLRALRALIKQQRIRLVDRGWSGKSSRKANTYEVVKSRQDGNTVPNTSGSSQDVSG